MIYPPAGGVNRLLGLYGLTSHCIIRYHAAKTLHNNQDVNIAATFSMSPFPCQIPCPATQNPKLPDSCRYTSHRIHAIQRAEQTEIRASSPHRLGERLTIDYPASPPVLARISSICPPAGGGRDGDCQSGLHGRPPHCILCQHLFLCGSNAI